MTAAAAGTISRAATPAFVDWALGRRPSRGRALLAAALLGATTCVLAYRLLRSAPAADAG